MKKKSAISVFIFLIVMLGSICLYQSCPGADQSAVGGLKLDLVDNLSRDFTQDISMDIVSYDIFGTGPGGASFEVLAFPNATITFDALRYGNWVIRVDGKNATGTIIGRGTQTIRVNTGETTTVQIVVLPLTGTGNLNITVNWNVDDTYLPNIEAHLISIATGTDINLPFTITNGNQGTFFGVFATGYYMVQIRLLDNGLTAYGTIDMARIIFGGTTTGVFNFTRLNHPGGTVDVQVTPQMDNPIDVTISGVFDEMLPLDSKTVTANIDPAAGPVSCVWYINGVSKDIGTSYTITGLNPGNYNAVAIVITADGRRGGIAKFDFTVLGDRPGPAFTLMQGGTTIPYNGVFDFDTIPAKNRDQDLFFMIRNTGSVSLALTGTPLVAIAGTNASAFTVNTSAMLNIIPPGGNTTFTIKLTSTAYTNTDLNASISIPNSIAAINPFPFTIHCTDKDQGIIDNNSTFHTPGTYDFVCPFTGFATISLCGAGGGGGGGGGGAYSPGNPPYVSPHVAPGSRGGNGGGGYNASLPSYQLIYGTPIRIIVGAAGNYGAGGAVNQNGSAGNNGQASRFYTNMTVVLNANGGNGGGGGATNNGPVGAAGSGGTCTQGGLYGVGGEGRTVTVTTGIAPYQTTTIEYHYGAGSHGIAGSNGLAIIDWKGFRIP
jgi:hypothetical protein